MVPNEKSVKMARNFLKLAIDKEDIDTIQALLKAGFPIDESITEHPFISPLMYAATQGKEQALRCLLDYMPDPMTTDRCGRNVIHLTAMSGQINTISILLENDLFDEA